MNNSTYFKANFPTASRAPTTRLPTALAIFVVSFNAINILAATVGNTCVCISLFRRRRNLREMGAHYLLGSLALTGLLSALLDMPSIIVMTVVNYFPIRDLPVAVEVFFKTKGRNGRGTARIHQGPGTVYIICKRPLSSPKILRATCLCR